MALIGIDMKDNFLVPDFYTDFHCKCGECRKPCCVGWDVTLTMKEYFALMGLDCSLALREKLDRALLLERNGSTERYGLLNKNYFGDCPLHGENGYCLLQCECGEEVLSSVCRLYPRSPKFGTRKECTLSNSCEGVVEDLWKKQTPISFCEVELSLSDVEKHAEPFDLSLREECLQLLTAAGSLKENLLALAERFLPDSAGECDLFALMQNFVETFASFSPDIAEYALERVPRQGFQATRIRLYEKFEGLDGCMKNLFVNNAFYKRLPFGEEGRKAEEEVTAFLLSYFFLDFLLVQNAERLQMKEDVVDLIASVFRLVNHTRFEYNALVLSHSEKGLKNAIVQNLRG